MKNIKLKIFTLSVLALLQTTAFCDSSNMIEAINNLRKDTMNALHGKDSTSLVNVLNTIFIKTPSTGTGKNTTAGSQSVIDAKIDGYVKNFYTLYATDPNFIQKELEIADKTELTYTDNMADLLKMEKRVKSGVRKQLNQEIYYDTQKTPLDKMKDIFALLVMPMEGGDNNINISSASKKGGSPYGSLDDSSNTSIPQSLLDVSVLVGPDGYEDSTAANKARLFISQLIKTAPPPKTFSFPQEIDARGNMTIYLPYTNTTANPPVPYTKVIISTIPPPSGGLSQYQKMLNYLNANSLYQEYKMKVRSLLALRTLFFEGIFNAFQERYKEKKTDSSLLEREKYMAMVGLTQTYYNNLISKSVADVNLETLHTLNKIVYFLYKLHQDNKRAQLITSISGIQVPLATMQDEQTYIKPIVTMINNGCWDTNVPPPNTSIAVNATTRASNCANPQSAN